MSRLLENLLDSDSDDVICESDTIVMPRMLKPTGKVKEDLQEPDESCSTSVNGKLKTDTDVELTDNNNVQEMHIKVDHDEDDENIEKDAGEEADGEPKLSKRARRRQEKRERLMEHRAERRKAEKQRRKERLRKQREQGEAVPRPQLHRMSDSKCKFRVAIDMAYEELMTDDLIRKTLSQLAFCYAANRKAENPLQYYITNLRGKTKAMFDSREGNTHWDVYMMGERLTELWSPADIVYLTADSENVLDKLDDSKTYVIGGLIDHNAHKGFEFTF